MPPASTARQQRVVEAVRSWRHELADVGGRNSLLWHREVGTGTLDVSVAHPSGVASLMSSSPTRLSQLVREKQSYAEALARLREIRAKIVSMRDQHGWQVGYIAVGMASWRMTGTTLPPRAPVLLRTVSLEPVDAAYDDFVITLGSDVTLNPVLEHYLRSELGIWVDAAELVRRTRPHQGFDPRPAYEALELACGDIPDFRISPQLVVGCFPLAKLSMVADIAAQAPGMTSHPLIAALAGDPNSRRALGAEREAVHSLPELAVSEEVLVLDADTDQARAVQLARRGESFVIDGAPGTGRTQTVANAVAALTAEGRRVVVVAEKAAALHTLRRRLTHVGLGRWPLPLREDTVGDRELAQHLLSALTDAESPDDPAEGSQAGHVAAGEDGITEGAILEQLEEALVALLAREQALTDPREPWGTSVEELREQLVRLAAGPRPPHSHVRLDRSTMAELTPARIETLGRSLQEAAEQGAWAPSKAGDPWYAAELPTEDDAVRARDIVARIAAGELTEQHAEASRLLASVGLPAPVSVAQWGSQLDLLEDVAETLDTFRADVYDSPLDQLVAASDPHSDRETDLGRVARLRLRRQAKDLLRPGRPPADLHAALVAAREHRRRWEEAAGRGAKPRTALEVPEIRAAYDPLRRDLAWLNDALRQTSLRTDLISAPIDDLLAAALLLDDRVERVAAIPRAYAVMQELRGAGLGPVADDLARRGVGAEHVRAELDFIWATSLLDHLSAVDPQVGGGSGADRRALLRRYRALDRAHLAATAVRVDDALRARVAQALQQHPQQAAALRSRLEAPGQAASMPELYVLAPDLIPALYPVWLVSPLAVGMCVPHGYTVDALVIEEAGRLAVSTVAPAIARARQVIAVGDRQGAGPQAFVAVPERRAEELAEAREMPLSVLHHLAEFLPVVELGWHYPSQDDRVVRAVFASRESAPRTLPSPHSRASVRTVVAGEEADAVGDRVAMEVLTHARTTPRESLAVVVEDPSQIGTITQAIRSRIVRAPDLRASFREDVLEPFVVLPLDDAQGTMRDVVLVVVGEGGRLSGPEAERWTGVALTRARRRLTVISGMAELPELLSRGVSSAVSTAGQPTASGAPAAGQGPVLLVDLARRLRAEGLTVSEAHGTGNDRIALAIADPQRPERMVLALEPEPSHAQHGRMRERYRLRHEQLVRLGWVPVPLSGEDLFRDPAREVARIVTALRQATEQA